jgi:putative serine protease PepD
MTEPYDPFADQPYVPPTPETPAAAESPVVSSPDTEATSRIDYTEVTSYEPTQVFDAPEPTQTWEVPTYSEPQYTSVPPAGPAEPVAPVAPSYASSAGTNGPTFTQPAPAPTLSPAPKKPQRAGKFVAAATGLVLLSGASALGGAAVYSEFFSDSNSTPTGSSTGTSLDQVSTKNIDEGGIQAVAAKVLPSTVKISFTSNAGSGSGSGIIISADGKILTNNHVVEEAADGGGTLTVSFNEGKRAKATIIGRDPATDVAVIQAEGVSGLTPATLGKSSEVRVGQTVVAIGSPFGLESTVTSGIVSALNRPVSPGSSSRTQVSTMFPAIQTDAAINPGNSGGALVDLSGSVIGINSAIQSTSTMGSEAGSIGLGFAIPIDLARNVSTQILAGKTVQHARIGVLLDKPTANSPVGATVTEVSNGSAAEKAGVKSGDVITGVNGHPVADNESLIATIRGFQPGEKVKLTVLRNNQTKEIELTLGSDSDTN